ncbi:MAG: lactate utilization protein [Alistipes senegalensis]|nr:lactate utilization protein [Oxalobacter formigenes]MCM1281390.1 lactate utilization protein [Alistipes senegalensis]
MDYTAIRNNLENYGFSTQLFSTGEEAKDYLAATLQQQTIGFGGSVSLNEIGLFEALSQKNIVVWHNKVLSNEVRRLANQCSIYITSVNAIAETGQIVNIDKTGNRIAMMAFGPKTCYYIVGKNKITPTLADALHRAKNIAAPKNARRLRAKTPCARNADQCYNCNTPDRVCHMTMIMDRPPYGMKAEIIFIDQNLGL